MPDARLQRTRDAYDCDMKRDAEIYREAMLRYRRVEDARRHLETSVLSGVVYLVDATGRIIGVRD